LPDYVTTQLGLKVRKPNLDSWHNLVDLIKHPDHRSLKIGVVAKYMDNEDTYMSVFEAIKSAGWANRVRPEICWIDAQKLEAEGAELLLEGYDGLVVPGGFGSRGVEGKIVAATYAMEHGIPYLGLCLGMQIAVIAKARQIGLENANTTEVDPDTAHPVIDIMESQRGIVTKGGNMRLGDYPCVLTADSLSAQAYGTTEITERHRHRWEFNNAYRAELEAAGLVLAGLSPDGSLVEVIELRDHAFFVASQFHPEFKSRPQSPHPLFKAFMAATSKHRAFREQDKRSIVSI
jgi:CTP synthase